MGRDGFRGQGSKHDPLNSDYDRRKNLHGVWHLVLGFLLAHSGLGLVWSGLGPPAIGMTYLRLDKDDQE